MEIKMVSKYEPTIVKMELEFEVHDPAKLIAAWASKVPSAIDMLTQEPDQPINWSACIADIMLEVLDEESIGVSHSAGTYDKNPEPQSYPFEDDEEKD